MGIIFYNPSINNLNTNSKITPALYATLFHSQPISQTDVNNETPFICNGLAPATYSEFPWQLWNPQTSRIHPGSLNEKYTLRIRFILSSQQATVATVKLYVPESSTLIYQKDFQPLKLIDAVFSEEFSFYSGRNFLQYGALLTIAATNVISEIKQPNLYFVRLAK